MNRRGEYGARPVAHPQAWTGQARLETRPDIRPETRRTLANHVVIGIGLLVGAVGWPLYEKGKPLGVIALGASGSMVSAGILGLVLGRSPSPGDS